MAQEYTVTNAFQQTVSKEDKTPKSFTSHGKTLYPWFMALDGVDGWVSINKQEGNVITPGDVIYGNIQQNQWGKNEFKSESRPLGNLPTPPRAPQPIPEGTSDLEAKIDYLTTLVEQLVEQRQDVILEDIEDKPIDLSEIPF